MYIRPVCLDFDYKFDEEQLKAGSLGKVAGWGYTSAAGQPSPFLKVAELPIVSLNRCFNETPHDFTSFITTDKICAGYTNDWMSEFLASDYPSVCLDFDYKFDEEQLKAGSLGKVAGWGYTSAAGQPSPFLKVAELPIVSLNRCFNETPHDFTSFITTDKICAGYTNGTAVCKGDSGGGLAFPEMTGHVTRYYLRGLVSTAPSDDLNCNTQTITAFTHLLRHQSFIQSHFIEYQKLKFLHFDSRMVTQYNYTDTECPN
ncbi:hypothetical protein B5X24_HaOG212966 [Helicoverpa armigera]|uniref:Peptidase S1 domain-containing protein n=1 Tax=Helicoverpa armigera TaxID=29058 RepID=A0A2W1BBS1_HELAM|nr:hypothetical protein B5X24_HaOG212966 [Helicoverpa armigera]